MNIVPKVPNNCYIHSLKLLKFKNHKKGQPTKSWMAFLKRHSNVTKAYFRSRK